ncbi:MAG TPA: hypothetical protein EYP40_00840 [Chromatiales bacterium]|nr:hypothetical protein [Chromatiales bacterium]
MLVQIAIIGVIAVTFYLHEDRVAMVKLPPGSLAQWYKPANKRQVWLHNMFKLRREMQAVRLYAESRDPERLEKWIARLGGDYRKISEMVPEWKRKLDLDAMASLEKASREKRYREVLNALERLKESCESCHTDYRAVTATLYRAPDFSTLESPPGRPLKKGMRELIGHVNRIKIAAEDGRTGVALTALVDLEQGMEVLGKTCAACHEKETPAYPGPAIRKTLLSLRVSLETGTSREQGRALGNLAVQACATCHGTHRIVSDSRRLFTHRQDWVQLLQH